MHLRWKWVTSITASICNFLLLLLLYLSLARPSPCIWTLLCSLTESRPQFSRAPKHRLLSKSLAYKCQGFACGHFPARTVDSLLVEKLLVAYYLHIHPEKYRCSNTARFWVWETQSMCALQKDKQGETALSASSFQQQQQQSFNAQVIIPE